MKKSFGYMLVFALLLLITPIWASNESNDNYIEVDFFHEISEVDELNVVLESGYSEEFFFNQMRADILFQNLMMSFNNGLEFSNLYDIVFPEYYAGSYVDDNGNFVVLIYDDVNYYNDINYYNEIIFTKANSNDFTLKSVEYSYNYLNNLMDVISNYKLHNNDSISGNFDIAFLHDAENRVYVFLNEYNESRIEEFKENVSDSNAIIFLESEGPLIRDVSPGDYIQVTGAGSGSSSVGYRARRNGQPGFVMTGHHGSLGQTVRWNGRDVGVITARSVSGSVDAAFVQAHGPINLTNTLPDGNQLLASTYWPSIGTLVLQAGGATGLTSGRILSHNVMFDTNTNMSLAQYSSGNGDSGGIVYGTNRLTVGIHVGRISFGSNAGAVYSRASDINHVLGTSRY